MNENNVEIADSMANAAKKMFDNRYSKEEFDWISIWYKTKDRFMRFVAALIMEKDKGGEWVISIGRLSWWLAFTPALYMFVAAFVATKDVSDASELVARDITPNHLTILLTLAGYNFSKKAMETVEKVWGNRNANDANEPSGDGPG